MKHSRTLLLAAAALAAAASCAPISDCVKDPSAGWNGGFEVARDGLPVNWLVYTPRKVPNATFTIALDAGEHREGAQALRFDVERCDVDAGRLTPGIASETGPLDARSFTLSFWVKDEGAAWRVRYGAVAAKRASHESIDGADVPAGEWTHVERAYTLPGGYERLRFELRVTSPGRLWIDDVRFDPAD